MATKGPPLQYDVASDDELEGYLAEPGLKGTVHTQPRQELRHAAQFYLFVCS